MARSKSKQKRVRMSRRQKWRARSKRIKERIEELKKSKKS